MKYRRQDANGDYVFGAGSDNFLFDTNAVVQAIKTKILLFYREWWEDLGIGIPFFQSILGQINNQTLQNSFSQLLQDRILEIREVVSIDDISVSYDKHARTLSASISARTIYNEAAVLEVNF